MQVAKLALHSCHSIGPTDNSFTLGRYAVNSG